MASIRHQEAPEKYPSTIIYRECVGFELGLAIDSNTPTEMARLASDRDRKPEIPYKFLILPPMLFANCSRSLIVRKCRSVREDLSCVDESQFEDDLDLRLKSSWHRSSSPLMFLPLGNGRLVP